MSDEMKRRADDHQKKLDDIEATRIMAETALIRIGQKIDRCVDDMRSFRRALDSKAKILMREIELSRRERAQWRRREALRGHYDR